VPLTRWLLVQLDQAFGEFRQSLAIPVRLLPPRLVILDVISDRTECYRFVDHATEIAQCPPHQGLAQSDHALPAIEFLQTTVDHCDLLEFP
jgi:hypothetical protein